MPKLKPSSVAVPPRAYLLTNTGLPVSRGCWYRWAKAGHIPPLLHIAGKTLVPAQTVDDIVSGKIVLPKNAGNLKPPMSRARRAKLNTQAAE